MMTYRSERGGTRLGCAVLLLLLGIFTYICYRIVPVYLEKEAFEDRVLSLTGRAIVQNWDDRKLIGEILEASRLRKFELDKGGIQIRRIPGRANIIVIVDYRRTEEFPGGYIYVFQFRSVLEGVYGI